MSGAEAHREVDVPGGRDRVPEGTVRLVHDGEGDPVRDVGDVGYVGRLRTVFAGRLIGSLVEVGCRYRHSAIGPVGVEPAAGLPAKAPCRDKPFLDRRWPESLDERVAGLAHPLVDARRSGQIHVDADEVHELERSHRVAGRTDGRIDLVDRRNASLEHRQRLEREWPVDSVDDETRRVERSGPAPCPTRSRRRRPDRSRVGAVVGAATTSTSGITGAGLKKCIPSTRAGRDVADAIAVTDSALVFVASSVSSGATSSSVRKIAPLRCEVLDGGLDHELRATTDGLDRRFSGQECEPPLDPCIGGVGIEVEPGRTAFEAEANPLAAALDRFGGRCR